MHKHIKSLLFLFIFLVAASLIKTVAFADSSNLWVSPAAIYSHKNSDVDNVPYSLNGNTDCAISRGPADCVITTAFGQMSNSSSVKFKGTSTFNGLVNFNSTVAAALPIPNSSTVMTTSNQPVYGVNLFFTKDISHSVTPSVDFGAGLTYHINRVPDVKLADKTGKLLPADPNSIGFSNNGKWMVVAEPNIAMLRVNLETFEVLPFGSAYNYTIGLNPAPKVAISNDGRYAMVSSLTLGGLDIYDLSTCGPVPSSITGPVGCQSRSLEQVLRQQIPGYRAAVSERFVSDDTATMYISYSAGSLNRIAKYTLTSGGDSFHDTQYLAMGDSYISGEGVFSYMEGTDTSNDKCHTSLLSYPLLIGQQLNYDSYHSVACSGAKMEDLLDTSRDYAGQNKEKIPRANLTPSVFDNISNNFLPGYIDQLDFVSKYQPKVVTLSVGGNDIGFSHILKRCLAPDTCYATYEDRLELVRLINSRFDDLVSTYYQIKSAGAPDAKVYVIGYPQIAMAGGNCGLNVHLNSQEVDFSRQLISYIDLTVQKAAAKAGVKYVDAQNSLNGHRLCETGNSNIAVNGLTAGNDLPDVLSGPIGNESYHPNALGHQLIEQAILNATNSFSLAMQAADSSAAPPAESALEILNQPHSGRAVNNVAYADTTANDTNYRNQPLGITLNGADFSIKAGSSVTAVINSDPITLGIYTTDASGSLVTNANLPGNVPLGFHTLHLLATNVSGSPVDIYKVIYIAADPNDFDGDGTPDSQDSCSNLEGVDGTQECVAKAPPNNPPPTGGGSLGSLTLAPPTLQPVLLSTFQLPKPPGPTSFSALQAASYSGKTLAYSFEVPGTSSSAKSPISASSTNRFSIVYSHLLVVWVAFLSIVAGFIYWRFGERIWRR